jgi:tetratricopeptide (TPR) repeat protein
MNFLYMRAKIVEYILPVVQEGIMNGGQPDETGKKGLTALLVLIIIPVIAGIGAAAWFIYKNTVGKRLRTTIIEDYRKEAEKYEKARKYVSAAAVYESKLKHSRKAAELYEKGGDLKRAAEIYDLLGDTGKAKELYKKSGRMKDAAEISMMEGEFEEAAKLYDKAGRKLDAAGVMVRSGRKLAAVRIYREAGQYRRASQLLEEEGMLNEAAEMFGFSLAGKKPEPGNLNDFYTYAFKLEKAGSSDKALKIYREIYSVDPAFIVACY